MAHSLRFGGIVLTVFAVCVGCGDDDGGDAALDGGDGGRQDGGVGDAALHGDGGSGGSDGGGDVEDAAVDASRPQDGGGEGDADVGDGPVVAISFAPFDDEVVAPNGEVRFELADGSHGDTRCKCVVVFGEQRKTIADCESPIEWTDLDDGATVDARVTCANHDGAVGPEARRRAKVDATGPTIRVTEQPGVSEVCPSSTDREERVLFEACDGPEAACDPVEPHGPVSFECSLDGDDPSDCSSGDDQGAFEWSTLADGSHQLIVVALDAFGNPGPVNEDSPLGVGEVVDFEVHGDPPAPPSALGPSANGYLDLNGIAKGVVLVTSGDSDVNVGARWLIAIRGAATSEPPVIGALAIDGQACDGDPCGFEPGSPVDAPVKDVNDEWVWDVHFAGLADENEGGRNPHTVTVTLHDECASNAARDSLEWVVDSTPNAIQLTGFDAPSVAAGATGPEGDVTATSGGLHFALFDEGSGDAADELPYAVACELGGGVIDDGETSCVQNGGPSVPSVTLSYSDDFTGASEGVHTDSVSVIDEVGNASSAVLSFCVDDSAPVITGFVGPSTADSCVTEEGLPVSPATNTIAFTVVDQGPPCGAAGLATASCQLFVESAAGEAPAGPAVDCSDLSFEFANLPENVAGAHYRLHVTAADGGGLQASADRDFVVDATGPQVVFTGPVAPQPATGGDPQGDVFGNIRDNALDYLPLSGSFTTAFDPSTQAPTFTCTVGGESEDCSGLSYSLARPETSSGYLVAIDGVDCAGNTSTGNTLRVFVDQQPPLVAMPSCPSSQCVLDSVQHRASIELTVADAITNVEGMYCLLDHDANGLNPDLADPSTVEFVSCASFGFTGLPARPAGDELTPRVPRAVTGTLELSELAPGRHRLWVSTTDFWGHGTLQGPIELVMDYADPSSGRFGDVIAIGHDFATPPVSADRLLGNAVSTSESMAFERPLRILTVDLGNAEIGDLDMGAPANVLAAIGARLLELGEPEVYIGAWQPLGAAGAASEIRSRLLGYDVLLVYDQNDPAASESLGANVQWLDALRLFAESGGTVIVLDGTIGGGQPSNTVQVLGNAETWNADEQQPRPDVQAEAVNLLDSFARGPFARGSVELDCDSTSPLAQGVGQPSGPFGTVTYPAPPGSVAFFQDPQANEVFSVNVDAFAPVVMHKLFPLRTDAGPIRVVAYDRGVPRSDADFALFHDAAGGLIHFCRLRPDGTASSEGVAGGSVSVASVNAVDHVLGLETVFDTKPLETIVIGSPAPRVQRLSDFVPDSIEGQLARFPNDDVAYFVTNGCASWELAQVPSGENVAFSGFDAVYGSNPTSDCLQDEVPGAMQFLAEVRTTPPLQMQVLAYARATVPYAFGSQTCGNGNAIDSGYCLNLADFTPWYNSVGELDVYFSGAAPGITSDRAEVQLAASGTAVGLDEGLSPDPTTVAYFAPKSPGNFASTVRMRGMMYLNGAPGSGGALVSSQWLRDRAPTVVGLPSPQYFDRSQFLPGIDAAVGGAIEQPTVQWAWNGSSAGVEGGFGVIGYAAAPSCADPSCTGFCEDVAWSGGWTFVVPPDATEARMPSLPAALACWQPSQDAVLRSVSFFDTDRDASRLGDRSGVELLTGLTGEVTRDVVRRASLAVLSSFFDPVYVPDTDTGANETRITSYCPNPCVATPFDPLGSAEVLSDPLCYVPQTLRTAVANACD